MLQVTRGDLRKTVTGWLFATPYVLLLVAFGLIPAIYAVYESLHTIAAPDSLSAGNYQLIFNDFRFWPAVKNVGTFMAIWIPVMVFGVLLLALLLHEKVSRFSSGMRLIYFLPGAVTGSAAVLLWYFMLSPQLSPFAPALKAMGIESNNEMFTTGHLPWIFGLVAFMTGVGNWVVIMFGALQSVPHEVMEAARIDGAGPIRIALRIKLPLIGKYVAYMMILSFAFALQIFVEPQLFYNITSAGSTSWSLNQLGYVFAFQQGDFGQAATVSVILLILSALAALWLVFRTNFFQTEVDE
jgi:multiple sugar transport system permease protein